MNTTKMITNDTDVWVLAGQSNMVGVGLLKNALVPDERVWSFSSAGKWSTAVDPLHRLWESFTPVNQVINRSCLPLEKSHLSDNELAEEETRTRISGAGLGISFGKTLADALDRPIGLIPAAHGGTTLDQWNPVKKNEGVHSLYGALLERVRQAGGRLRGILWYQGESDSGSHETFSTYAQRLDALVNALRTDLHSPELPFIAVQLGRPIAPENDEYIRGWQQIREDLRTLPDRMPFTGVTSAIDLGLADTVHISTAGLIRLGKRMARIALSLTDHPELGTGPRLKKLYGEEAYSELGLVRVVCQGVTGGWFPRDCIPGFQVCSEDGKPHPDPEWRVINAFVENENPTTINVLLTHPPDNHVYLGYGLGLDPCCIAVDEADMPLCAFNPKPIEFNT